MSREKLCYIPTNDKNFSSELRTVLLLCKQRVDLFKSINIAVIVTGTRKTSLFAYDGVCVNLLVLIPPGNNYP